MRSFPSVPRPAGRRLPALGLLATLLFGLLAGASLGACSGHADQASPSMSAVPMDHPGAVMTHDEAVAAWDARPAFVSGADPATQAAYEFAVERSDVLRWIPCYCGCGSIGHLSNLECFVKPRADGAAVAFEEHASYCDICVKIALDAKQLVGQGMGLGQVRAAIDAGFGSSGIPGTPTALPPS